MKGRIACDSDEALDTAADSSVLLVYWKLKDQLADENGLRKLPAAMMLVLFRRTFQKAIQHQPELHSTIGKHMVELRNLELENCTSIDRTADQFARIMTAMVPSAWDEPSRRSLEQLLYHLGRWIYLIDAWDDLDEDLKRGGYNPVALRFELLDTPDSISAKKEAEDHLKLTLVHSENLAISAFHLGCFGHNTQVIENVLCAGLQSVRHMVFSGTWKQAHKQKKQELKHL